MSVRFEAVLKLNKSYVTVLFVGEDCSKVSDILRKLPPPDPDVTGGADVFFVTSEGVFYHAVYCSGCGSFKLGSDEQAHTRKFCPVRRGAGGNSSGVLLPPNHSSKIIQVFVADNQAQLNKASLATIYGRPSDHGSACRVAGCNMDKKMNEEYIKTLNLRAQVGGVICNVVEKKKRFAKRRESM